MLAGGHTFTEFGRGLHTQGSRHPTSGWQTGGAAQPRASMSGQAVWRTTRATLVSQRCQASDGSRLLQASGRCLSLGLEGHVRERASVQVFVQQVQERKALGWIEHQLAVAHHGGGVEPDTLGVSSYF